MNKHCCEQIDHVLEEGNVAVVYIASYRKYAIQVNRQKFEKIDYCPWCGIKLPESLQDKYFEELKKLGVYDPMKELEKIPDKFKDDTWWRINK